MVWCGSTEIYLKKGPAHETIEAFEAAIDADDDQIAPSMLYAYAAIMAGVPYAHAAANLPGDTPALPTTTRSPRPCSTPTRRSWRASPTPTARPTCRSTSRR